MKIKTIIIMMIHVQKLKKYLEKLINKYNVNESRFIEFHLITIKLVLGHCSYS